MERYVVDVTVEFLAVAFHNILYYSDVYPKSIFEARRKYNVVVYRTCHPGANHYIDRCLRSIAECLRRGQMKRIEFAVTDDNYNPVMKFIFDIYKCSYYDGTGDPYLVTAEQNLRAFCLNLSNSSYKFKTPENASFVINLHTTESAAVAMAANPDLDDFPLVHVANKYEVSNGIIPLRCFFVKDHNIDAYIKLCC